MKNKDIISPNALFILDGSYLLYRSYYALQALHTSDGRPTQAVFGFCRAIKKIIDLFHPKHFVVVWDSKGGSFRNELYTQYKAHRTAPPSDLFEQKEAIIAFLETIGLASIAMPGYEADDIIGTLARQQLAKQTLLLCADKDMYQLLTPDVLVADIFKDLIVTEDAFEAENGFAPSKIPFYYALLGDASDNIPGVKGVGKKTAQTLVMQFKSLDDLYAHIDQINSPRIAKLLQEHKNDAELSLKLFSLATAPLEYSLASFNFDQAQWNNARGFFEQYQLHSLTKTISQPPHPTKTGGQIAIVGQTAEADAWQAVLVDSKEKLQEMVRSLSAAKYFSLDTETTGLDCFRDQLIGIALCGQETKSYFVPVTHNAHQHDTILERDTILNALRPLLQDPKKPKVLHHAKFDTLVLSSAGLKLDGIAFDTVLAANLLKEEWQRINLKELSFRFLGEPMQTYEDILGKKYKDFSQVPLDIIARYGALDARQTLRLKPVLEEALTHEPVLMNFFKTIEMPLCILLIEMEEKGIMINLPALRNLDHELGIALARSEEKIFSVLPALQLSIGEISGINLNSPRQIEHMLFDVLRLPVIAKTDKGARSTDQEVLEELAKIHPIPGMILKFRELSKLKSTYTEPLQTAINPKTGRIHTTFSQTIVATGRLSSMNPNLQNIPTGSEYGHRLRSTFVAAPGYELLSADYSQIELRVLAHVTGDPGLIDAFLHNRDIHRQTASQLFDVPQDQVTNEQRQLGKTINFSIIYGKTPYGLSKALGISLADAKKYIQRYFEQYPEVKVWMERVVTDATATGYVSSLWGRRRYVPELKAQNRMQHEAARRVAVNAPIQGSSADLMKVAMLRVADALKKAGLEASILLQIHDEMILEIAERDVASAAKIVEQEMTHAVDWKVPLAVSIRTGKNWGDITK